MGKLLFLAAFCLVQFAALAQNFCGTDMTTEDEEYFNGLAKEGAKSPYRNETVYVPIAFFIETYSGNPVYNSANLQPALDECNTWFEGADIVLEQCGEPFYYENGDGYTFINNVINVNIATSYDGCGVYYGNITIDPTCNRPFDEILAHEVGHALGLPHTHGYTNMGTTDELVDGSNCATHGDKFCDTPADPNLLYHITSSCVYTGNMVDANGDQYVPNTHNIMSYTYPHCPDHFSGEQMIRMHDVALGKNYNCCLIALPEVDDEVVCKGTTATFDAAAGVDSLTWYDQPEGGSPLWMGLSFTTPTLETSTSYYVDATQGCTTDRVKVDATVIPPHGVFSSLPERMSDLEASGDGQAGGEGGYLYFNKVVVTDSLVYLSTNNQLYSFNGDQYGTELIYTFDIAGGTSITDLAAGDGYLLVALNDWNASPALWKTDGTAGGTAELMAFSGAQYSNYWLTAFNGGHAFAVTGSQDAELWYSDGSVAGTQLIKTLEGTSGYNDFDFTVFDNRLWFNAVNDTEGSELWSSDGTEIGTQLFADILPGSGSSYAYPVAVHQSHLIFVADDGVNGSEMWRTSGVAGDQELITDINPSGGSSIGNVVSIGSNLYFYADDGVVGLEPFYSNGTPGNATLIGDILPVGGSFPGGFTEFDGKVFFGAKTDGGHPDLYAFDPSTSELQLVKDIGALGYSGVNPLFESGGKLYFAASISDYDTEVWQSDGTPDGTFPAGNINELNGSWPQNWFELNNQLCFTADDGVNSNQIWTISDPQYTLCSGETALLLSGNTSGDVNWYDSDTGGNLLGTGYTYETVAITQSTTVWADLTIDGCESDRTAFEIVVPSIETIDYMPLVCNESTTLVTIQLDETISDALYSIDNVDFQSDPAFAEVLPGLYDLSAKVSETCTLQQSIEISEAEALVLSANESNVLCSGESNGSITGVATGGTGNTMFSLDDSPFQSSPLFSALGPGDYVLHVQDSLECPYDSVLVTISEPGPLELSTMIVPTDCGDNCIGGIEIEVTGGTGIHQFEWSQNGTAMTDEDGAMISDLCAGEYTALVTDENACEEQSGTIQIQEPEYLDWYFDGDGDGFGLNSSLISHCAQPANHVLLGEDCDDENDAIYPGAPGDGTGVDVDCDGQIDQTETTCIGDFNFDMVIDTEDLLILLSGIGCSVDCILDMDGNDEVNTSELLSFLAVFGTVCL